MSDTRHATSNAAARESRPGCGQDWAS